MRSKSDGRKRTITDKVGRQSSAHFSSSASFRQFSPSTLARVDMGLLRSPWRFQTKRRNASQQKPTDWARRVFAIVDLFLTLGKYLAGHRSIFGKFDVFFQIHETVATQLSNISQ